MQKIIIINILVKRITTLFQVVLIISSTFICSICKDISDTLTHIDRNMHVHSALSTNFDPSFDTSMD